jgi:glycosyltransferase involved in cell wall biosynthesis
MERKPGVAVVFHHIGPYHHARLNAAAARLPVTGIEWSAKAYDAWGTAESSAHYHKISLFAEATDEFPAKSQLQRAFCSALEQVNPDVVAVNGWNNFGSLIAASCCARRGIPMIVMSESARGDEARSWWKETIKRRMLEIYSAALVGGQRHADYLVELGMPRERIFTGYDVVDDGYFRQKAEKIRKQTSEIRKKCGLPQSYFLASARFIKKKNLPRLIRAYKEYRDKPQRAGVTDSGYNASALWDLVLLGDGPLESDLRRLISDLRLNDCVHLPGFQQYQELPIYYALANAFVHASTSEQWGLVVNEAIASGLPVIVSERCGCAPELVQDNGFTFDPMDEHELASLLLKMATLSIDERSRLGHASYTIAANFSPEHFAKGLEEATQLAFSQPRHASLLGRTLIKLP